jgi:hypothetical protein
MIIFQETIANQEKLTFPHTTINFSNSITLTIFFILLIDLTITLYRQLRPYYLLIKKRAPKQALNKHMLTAKKQISRKMPFQSISVKAQVLNVGRNFFEPDL